MKYVTLMTEMDNAGVTPVWAIVIGPAMIAVLLIISYISYKRDERKKTKAK